MLIDVHHQDERKETVFGDRELTYEVRRLKEFQQYEFWVTASTIIGEGQSSIKVPQAPVSRGEISVSGIYYSCGILKILCCRNFVIF
jgi:hypothetical protein